MHGKAGRLAAESVLRHWPPADFKRPQDDALLLPVIGIIFRRDVLREQLSGPVIDAAVLSPQHGEKIRPLSPAVRRRSPYLRHIAGYSLGISEKKASAISYGTAFIFFPSQPDPAARAYVRGIEVAPDAARRGLSQEQRIFPLFLPA